MTIWAQDKFDLHIEQLLTDRKRTMTAFVAGHRTLNIYAIYRSDLEMPPGKLAAQCGHAFDLAYQQGCKSRPDVTDKYRGTGNGTKICMYARNLMALLRAYKEALEAQLPCELIIDRGHVMLPHFDGQPIITALGIGPIYRDEAEHILKRYTMNK